jgi:hypothetical protein
MSDNLTTPVASGAVLATDDVSGVQYPRVKISFGVDGAAADVHSASRFPVDVGTSIAVTQSGTWNITNISGTISLPTGAATSALQTTGNTSLASIATALASPLPVSGTFWQATQPISASSLPLPTGAATSANQTTGNTSLAAIAASTAAAEPAATGGAVSPSDSTVLSGVRALYVGGAGTVVATVGGVDLTFVAVPVGTQLQIKATKVKAATTATNIVWLG